MTVRRVYEKASRTPKQLAELRATRAKYQRDKPSAEQALAASGHESLVPLGGLIQLHELFAALKAERMRLGMTLAQVESATGIDQATLSKLEGGKHGNPTMTTIIKISGALGKQVRCTLVEDESRPPKPAARRSNTSTRA